MRNLLCSALAVLLPPVVGGTYACLACCDAGMAILGAPLTLVICLSGLSACQAKGERTAHFGNDDDRETGSTSLAHPEHAETCNEDKAPGPLGLHWCDAQGS